MVTIIKRVGVGMLISDSRIQSKGKYQRKRMALHDARGINALIP